MHEVSTRHSLYFLGAPVLLARLTNTIATIFASERPVKIEVAAAFISALNHPDSAPPRATEQLTRRVRQVLADAAATA